MTHAIIVVGSARPGRVADSVAAQVAQELSTYSDVTASIVDLAELNLPFFNNEHVPSDPNYNLTDERVIAWSKLVGDADVVIFVTPEYNHTLSAIQKNAIDSLYKEWNDKQVAVVAYGWAGGARSVSTLKEVATVVKMNVGEHPAELFFTKDLATDGSIIDAASVKNKIHTALDDIIGS